MPSETSFFWVFGICVYVLYVVTLAAHSTTCFCVLWGLQGMYFACKSVLSAFFAFLCHIFFGFLLIYVCFVLFLII